MALVVILADDIFFGITGWLAVLRRSRASEFTGAVVRAAIALPE